MTHGRLTIRTSKGAALKLDAPATEMEAREQLMAAYRVAIEKLANFEDFAERAVSIPLGTWTKWLADSDTVLCVLDGKDVDEEETTAALRGLAEAIPVLVHTINSLEDRIREGG